MLNKQYILDYLKTHNQINDKNRVVIENIIDCASEFSPNYLESDMSYLGEKHKSLTVFSFLKENARYYMRCAVLVALILS